MDRLSERVANLDISVDILNFLANRFLYNVPKEERSDIIKFFFNIEKAYWFYEDNLCTNMGTNELQYRLKPFAFCICRHVPFLYHHLWDLDEILKQFNLYKKKMPKYGAILISANMDKVLLVQSCWGKCTWAFPKGKADENEDSLICAAREVYEETGFDIATLVQPDSYIEELWRGEYTKLYIVKNVPMNTIFMPRTKNEIKSCKWFNMHDLLTSTGYILRKSKISITCNTFSMKKKLNSFLNEQYALQKVTESVKIKNVKCLKDVETQMFQEQYASQKVTESLKIKNVKGLENVESQTFQKEIICGKSQILNEEPMTTNQIESKISTILCDIIKISIIVFIFGFSLGYFCANAINK